MNMILFLTSSLNSFPAIYKIFRQSMFLLLHRCYYVSSEIAQDLWVQKQVKKPTLVVEALIIHTCKLT